MSEENDASEKSFEPTTMRLQDARKKGDVPKSNEITVAATYAAFALCLVALGQHGLSDFALPLSSMLEKASDVPIADGASGPKIFSLFMGTVYSVVLAVFLVPAIAALVALTAQRAIVFAPEKLNPKLSRISPLQGLKNKFGANGLFEFGKSAVKLLVISVTAAYFVMANLEEFLTTVDLGTRSMSSKIGTLIIELVFLAFIVNLMIGSADFFWQQAQHRKRNMMSRKEVQDEAKESEGDPHLKQKRRNRATEIATNHMLADVPGADVVIVNPTHFAVALKWDRSSDEAPVCVAKGVDQIAARIREAASEATVPIFSDPPTARALFALVDIGQSIHSDHYKAVAAAIRFAETVGRKKGMSS